MPHSSDQPLLREIDLKTALQYGTAQGYPPLFVFLRNFTRNYLHPAVPYAGGPEIILTCGSTDGFSKALSLLTNEWHEGVNPVTERQGMLCEEFAYMQAIQSAAPRGLNIVPVAIDEVGMMAEGEGGLREVMENWDMGRGKRPHIMYTVTIGQNPTSTVLPVSRRKELYAICSEYDIIIIEDEPYWYMQYPSSVPDHLRADYFPNVGTSSQEQPPPLPEKKAYTLENLPIRTSTGSEFIDSLTPSYLSIDYEGRVVRLDTCSKTIAPGCRLGWTTAQPDLIERLQRITETSTQQPSGFVQSMVAELLMGERGKAMKVPDLAKDSSENKGWGHVGFIRWLEGLRGDYERRMSAMADVLEEGKYLTSATTVSEEVEGGTSTAAVVNRTRLDSRASGSSFQMIEKQPLLFDFTRPRGGMFVWLRMAYETHPLYGGDGSDSPPSSSSSTDTATTTNTIISSSHPTKRTSMSKPQPKPKKIPGPILSKALWVYLTAKPFQVLSAPGTIFSPTDAISNGKGWRYFRLSFSAVEEHQIGEISGRFVDGVRRFWEITNPEEVWRIVGEDEERGEGTCVVM